MIISVHQNIILLYFILIKTISWVCLTKVNHVKSNCKNLFYFVWQGYTFCNFTIQFLQILIKILKKIYLSLNFLRIIRVIVPAKELHQMRIQQALKMRHLRTLSVPKTCVSFGIPSPSPNHLFCYLFWAK